MVLGFHCVCLVQASLNPCYSGCCSDGRYAKRKEIGSNSLNPCYSGCCSDGKTISIC